MILVPDRRRRVLVTIGTRGYAENGAGAEVRFGEGIGGMVAEARKPIRISGLMRGMLYALRHAPGSARSGRAAAPADSAAGTGNPESQLGVPLLVRGELVGVLCLESEVPYRFHEEDKASIELLGNYLAIAIQNMQLRTMADALGKVDATRRDSPRRVDRARARRVGKRRQRRRREIVYYAADECILVDGEYLIRSLPAQDSVAAPDGVRRPAAATSSRIASFVSTSRSTCPSARTTSRAACSCSAGGSSRSARTSSSCPGRAAALGSSWRATLR